MSQRSAEQFFGGCVRTFHSHSEPKDRVKFRRLEQSKSNAASILVLLAIVCWMRPVRGGDASSENLPTALPSAAVKQPQASSALALPSLADLAEKLGDSVVRIDLLDSDNEEYGQGTGFFMDEAGTVITNLHVIRGASQGTVRLNNKKSRKIVAVLAMDIESDLALLQTAPKKASDKSQTVPVQVSDSPPLRHGDPVFSIGSPRGLDQTLGTGVVSGFRKMKGINDLIQITVPLSGGASGSPVFTVEGKLIGIATMGNVDGELLNFAVSVERIKKLKPRMRVPLLNLSDISLLVDVDVRDSNAASYCLEKGKDIVEKLTPHPDYLEGAAFFAYPFWACAIYHDPQSFVALLEAARVNIRVGDFKKGREFLENAVKIQPNNPMALATLARILCYQCEVGAKEKARQLINQALALKPKDFWINYMELEVYGAEKDAMSFSRKFDQMIVMAKNRNPRDRAAVHSLKCRYDLDTSKKFKGEANSCRDAIKEYPFEIHAWCTLRRAAIKYGNQKLKEETGEALKQIYQETSDQRAAICYNW